MSSNWPLTLLFGLSYFGAVQTAFYLSNFTTSVPIAFLPFLYRVLFSDTRVSADLLMFAVIFFGNLSLSVVFGESILLRRLVPLALTTGFLAVTWLVVERQAFGEAAIWYQLLATPIVGTVSVVLLFVGRQGSGLVALLS